VSDVVDGTVGRELQRLRKEKVTLLPCSKCGGFAMVLFDGKCKVCDDNERYHAG
jgi:hypothetical protein